MSSCSVFPACARGIFLRAGHHFASACISQIIWLWEVRRLSRTVLLLRTRFYFYVVWADFKTCSLASLGLIYFLNLVSRLPAYLEEGLTVEVLTWGFIKICSAETACRLIARTALVWLQWVYKDTLFASESLSQTLEPLQHPHLSHLIGLPWLQKTKLTLKWFLSHTHAYTAIESLSHTHFLFSGLCTVHFVIATWISWGCLLIYCAQCVDVHFES